MSTASTIIAFVQVDDDKKGRFSLSNQLVIGSQEDFLGTALKLSKDSRQTTAVAEFHGGTGHRVRQKRFTYFSRIAMMRLPARPDDTWLALTCEAGYVRLPVSFRNAIAIWIGRQSTASWRHTGKEAGSADDLRYWIE